jgi:hypothetical protein
MALLGRRAEAPYSVDSLMVEDCGERLPYLISSVNPGGMPEGNDNVTRLGYKFRSRKMEPFITGRREAFRQRVADLVRGSIGRALEALHAPAKIREFEWVDRGTNEIVYLSTGARYSVLHVGAKRLFFDRVTGQFDGTGELLEERVADGLELLN